MDTVRDLFRGAATSTNSYSIYHGVDDQDGAELHVEENHDGSHDTISKKSWQPQVSQQCKKILIGVSVTALVAFLIGILVAYGSCSKCKNNEPSEDSPYERPQSEEPSILHWSDLRDLFYAYLKDGEDMERNIRRASRSPHPTGSDENKDLAQFVLQNFKTYGLDHTWIDNHFVELQYPDSRSQNTLKIMDADNKTVEDIFIDRNLYSPYSATGSVVAGLVYANFGSKDDFKMLEGFGVNVSRQLVIVRAGNINFAEKVYNAESAGAAGVLIFPDTKEDTAIYGHVHLGSGDPNTPGFPSFNHTQFPSYKSAGLPKIPAQPISTSSARKLLSKLTGGNPPSLWNGLSFSLSGLGPELQSPSHRLQLEVHNVARSVELFNVFGSVTGRSEPEHYIVVGAQRDSWGPGAAKSAVGTAILLELARTISVMVKNGFQPHRSLLFVSWDAGDFGSVGATEWLEGYLSMLHLKAAAYMSLDTAVLGDEMFVAKSSPVFKKLIEFVIKKVDNPRRSQQTIYDFIVSQYKSDWQSEVFLPLAMDTDAFAFTAFGGVPALEFSFVEESQKYQYLDTMKDTYDSLNAVVNGRLPAIALSVAQVAGLSLIKLIHDNILPLDYTEYNSVLLKHVLELSRHQQTLKSLGLDFDWLSSARGDYTRATKSLKSAVSQSDLNNEKMVQTFNVRIMRVEFYFLSQYVSAITSPYRHILVGRGEHTVQALLDCVRQTPDKIDPEDLRKKLALFTWTVKGAANALSGEVWELQKSF
ncbi:transferrin receptor protein 2 [Spea bombifrons]|uniref:transferrin receptor protein 2 n=1 Tax=Spea bombifrons TaxID=233779 RepID=UPI00234A62E5|nr:transferrin receptor protein 2 [Spea bombifrons]